MRNMFNTADLSAHKW